MTTSAFWPNGARLAMSLSLMFEGRGQTISGAAGVIPDPIQKDVPDLPTNAFFAYEGIPRVGNCTGQRKPFASLNSTEVINRRWSLCSNELIQKIERVSNKQSTARRRKRGISILNIGC